jgi:hypothetical protein
MSEEPAQVPADDQLAPAEPADAAEPDSPPPPRPATSVSTVTKFWLPPATVTKGR